MNSFDLQTLLNADDAIKSLIERASGFHPDHPHARDALQMVAALVLARSYIADYAVNIARGTDDDEALLAVLRGDTKLSPASVDAAIESVRKALH